MSSVNIQFEETQGVSSSTKSLSYPSPSNSQQQQTISSSEASISDVIDLSSSFNEPPSQPILSSYPLNKDKRSFRSCWFAQYKWLEYSKQSNLAYCYYCRHLNSGSYFDNRVT